MTEPTVVEPDIFPRRRIGLLTLCLASFLIVVDNLIVNVALPTFARELAATTTDLQWIVDAYTLVLAGLLLTAGSAVDRYGRKRGLILGTTLFAIFSVYAAYATTPTQLITARALMGIGAAIIFPATLASITNLFPEPKERARAVALWTAVSGAGVAFGPIIGGWLLEHFWWGSIFFVNIFVAAAIIVGAIFGVRESFDPHPRRFDPIGMVLSISSITILVWSIIEAPNKGWASPIVLSGIGIASVLLFGFVVWELRSSHPMLDVRYFTRRGFAGGNFAVTAVFLSLFGMAFLGIQYFQFVLGLSPLQSGVRLLPLAASTAVFSLLAPLAVKRFGSKVVITLGVGFTALAMLNTSLIQVDNSYWYPVGCSLILLGIGIGFASAPATDAVLASMSSRDTGVGSAMNDTTREFGGALGVAISGSVLASIYSSKIVSELAGTPATQEAIDTAKNSIGGAHAVSIIADQKLGVSAGNFLRNLANVSFVEGAQKGFLVLSGILAFATVVTAILVPKRVASRQDR